MSQPSEIYFVIDEQDMSCAMICSAIKPSIHRAGAAFRVRLHLFAENAQPTQLRIYIMNGSHTASEIHSRTLHFPDIIISGCRGT